MTKFLAATSGLFRDRDFFVHDGTQLRRFRLSASVQIVFAAALLTLVGWSSYAVARFVTPASVPATTAQVASTVDYAAKVAQLAAETERRVKLIEDRQLALAAALADENIDQSTLRRMGFYPPQAGQEGRGGPFDGNTSDPTFKQLFTSWKKLDSLSSGAIAVPSDKPVQTAAFMSGYGVRADPFSGAAARHMGIDLAGPSGTPIHATADGVIVDAGWNSGGYGNLIKVDHGRGIETRYAHLSRILVRPGQRVTRGQIIGRMGSTGRSTGSHLHYEVRIEGKAVNPVPFMKSTDYLLAMQKSGGGKPMHGTVALGGPQEAKR